MLNQFQGKNVEKPILYPIPAGFVADRPGAAAGLDFIW